MLYLDTLIVSNTQILNQGPYSAFFSLTAISSDESSSFLASLDPREINWVAFVPALLVGAVGVSKLFFFAGKLL